MLDLRVSALLLLISGVAIGQPRVDPAKVPVKPATPVASRMAPATAEKFAAERAALTKRANDAAAARIKVLETGSPEAAEALRNPLI